MRPRDTFNFTDGSDEHCWIVLLVDGDTDDAAALCVNISTYHQPCDENCILERDDHDSVEHKSFVFYAYTRDMTVGQLKAGLADETLKPRERMRRDVFDRVVRGALASRAIRPRHLAMIRAAFPEA